MAHLCLAATPAFIHCVSLFLWHLCIAVLRIITFIVEYNSVNELLGDYLVDAFTPRLIYSLSNYS
jgi:hypothetical protein